MSEQFFPLNYYFCLHIFHLPIILVGSGFMIIFPMDSKHIYNIIENPYLEFIRSDMFDHAVVGLNCHLNLDGFVLLADTAPLPWNGVPTCV